MKEAGALPVYTFPKEKTRADMLAKHAFIAGFCSFIPIVGWAFGILGLTFGAASLIGNRDDPSKRTEKIIAIIGLSFALLGLLAGITVVFVYFPGFFPALSHFSFRGKK